MPDYKWLPVIVSLLLCFQMPITQAAETNASANATGESRVHLSPRQLERLRIARAAVQETLRGDFDKFGYDKQTFASPSEAERMVAFFETIAYVYSNYIDRHPRLGFGQKMEVTRVIMDLAFGKSEQDIGRNIKLEYLSADDVAEILSIYRKKKDAPVP